MSFNLSFNQIINWFLVTGEPRHDTTRNKMERSDYPLKKKKIIIIIKKTVHYLVQTQVKDQAKTHVETRVKSKLFSRSIPSYYRVIISVKTKLCIAWILSLGVLCIFYTMYSIKTQYSHAIIINYSMIYRLIFSNFIKLHTEVLIYIFYFFQ